MIVFLSVYLKYVDNQKVYCFQRSVNKFYKDMYILV